MEKSTSQKPTKSKAIGESKPNSRKPISKREKKHIDRIRLVAETAALLIKGYSKSQITCFLHEAYQVGQYVARDLIRDAIDVVVGDLETQRYEAFAIEMAARNELYRLAFEQGKLGLCLAIASDRAKLLQLYHSSDRMIAFLQAQGYEITDPLGNQILPVEPVAAIAAGEAIELEE